MGYQIILLSPVFNFFTCLTLYQAIPSFDSGKSEALENTWRKTRHSDGQHFIIGRPAEAGDLYLI